jgi:UPF0042 nucleotide-binding protein
MKLLILSGRSGSGKSIALGALEDLGFHCIDNLPASLLEALLRQAEAEQRPGDFAISIDARSLPGELQSVPARLALLRKAHPRLEVQVIYLDAETATLHRRFGETRRPHPLTTQGLLLTDALAREHELLEDLRARADLLIDTTRTNVHSLRDQIQRHVGHRHPRLTTLMLRSFGFKHGVPQDADLVFDVRFLPNPHWETALRPLTGRDPSVVAWLASQEEVETHAEELRDTLQRWQGRLEASGRAYLTVAVGCTGGQHRSVYLAERLGDTLSPYFGQVLIAHRELHTLGRSASSNKSDRP